MSSERDPLYSLQVLLLMMLPNCFILYFDLYLRLDYRKNGESVRSARIENRTIKIFRTHVPKTEQPHTILIQLKTAKTFDQKSINLEI